MKLTTQHFTQISAALAAAISQIKAEPGPKMQLMPKTHNPYWRVHLEFTFAADGSVKLLPVPLDDVNAHLKVGAHPLGEVGVQGIEDGLGEGVFIDGVVDGLSDAAVEGESQAGLGEGDLDFDHGAGSEAQPGAGVN